MKNIRHKTPTEESFLIWMSNYPESFHDLDDQRFYRFARCIFSYNAKRWLNKEYFTKRILELNPNFQLDNIDEFYKQILISKKYNESTKLDCIGIDLNGDGYVQRQFINNEINEVTITKDEFFNKGISKKEFVARLSEYDKSN